MLRALTTLALIGTAIVLPPPGDVIIRDIDGLSVLDARLELDFEAYEEWAPELVDHVDPASEAAAGFEGAYRIWGGDGIDGVITNVTLWSDVDATVRYVDQAAREAAGLGLRAQNSPFDDVLMFEGEADDGTYYTYLTWRNDRYGVAMVGVGEALADTAVAAAEQQQVAIDAGLTAVGAPPSDESDGGSGIVSLIVVLALVAGMSWMYVSVRRTTKRQRAERLAAADATASPDEA